MSLLNLYRVMSWIGEDKEFTESLFNQCFLDSLYEERRKKVKQQVLYPFTLYLVIYLLWLNHNLLGFDSNWYESHLNCMALGAIFTLWVWQLKIEYGHF